MTLNGYLSTECDIKSPAHEFFATCIKAMELPKDNVTVETEAVPLEKKKTSYRIEGFQISDWYDSLKRMPIHDVAKWENLDGYKKLEGIMTVTHVEDDECDRGRAILTLKYEKISSDIEDPKSIMKTFVELVTSLDEFLKNRH